MPGSMILLWICVSLFLLFIRIQRPKNFPPGPWPLPVFGNLLQLSISNPLKDFERLAGRYGNVYSLYFGGRPAVVLNGLQAVKEALVTKGTGFSGRPQNMFVSHVTEGKGVIFTDYGPGWKDHHRFALMTLRNFGLGKQSMGERILGETEHVVAELEKHADESLKEYVRCFTENMKIENGPWAMRENGDGLVDEPLQNFLSWCDKVNLTLSSKVYLSKEGTVAEYGMLAKEDIEEGHVLFSIPRPCLLHHGTSKTSTVLEEGKASLESASGWVPLLLALMHEYTSPESHWRPYLSLWPDFRKLDHPMFWPKEERERLLKGTGVPEAVDRDLTNIQKEYNNTVLPFMRSHPDLWDPEKHTLELYQSLVAFVMAYSFQEPVEEDDVEEEEEVPNPPMMVPMADMLNHVSSHNANLEYTPDYLKMVVVRQIRKGEEIFNTYGQMANWQLLHMYGFSEPFPTNSNDTADIQMCTVYQASKQVTQREAEQRLLQEKWDLLCEMGTVGESGVFVFGKNGSLTDSELYTTLKVLCMTKEEFKDFRENEGWEEDEGEDEDSKMAEALSVEGLPSLAPAWKRLLHVAIGLTLDQYSSDLKSDQKLLEESGSLKKVSHREVRALHVRLGQKNILHRLQQLTLPSTV